MIRFEKRGRAAALHGIPPFIAELLGGRGIDTDEKLAAFRDLSLSSVSDPASLPGMKEAVRLLFMHKGETVVIYGDYDADGVCASAILTKAFSDCGIVPKVYLPDRKGEGYGLNRDAVDMISTETKLLVTVDNGITAVDEIAYAKKKGLKVIVTDHHHRHDVLPPADVLVCPTLGGWPFEYYCGAGVAWQLARALCGKRAALKLLDLCALATFADMVPLTGENRVIAANGLKAIEHTENAGLRALMDAAMLAGPLTSSDVSFRLAPRINACGRVDSAQIALQLLTCRETVAARELAARTQQLNDLRKETEKQVYDEAKEKLEDYDLAGLRAIVLWENGWDSGVAGLAAGRIAQDTGYPTVILAVQGDKMTGSARSAGGVDIHEALSGCRDLFIRFGGHKQAAGMTMEAKNAPLFRKRLSDEVEKQLQGRQLMPCMEYDSEIALSDITEENIRLTESFAPFGTGNPEPRFLVRNAEKVSLRPVGSEGQHLKCAFRQGSVKRDGIAYFMSASAETAGERNDLLILPQLNLFRGTAVPEMQVLAIRSAASLPEKDIREQTALLEDLLVLADEKYRGQEAAPAESAEDALRLYAGKQGVCVVCRTRRSAEKLLEEYPEAQILRFAAADRRVYFSLLLGGTAGSVTAPFEHLILYDGEMCSGEKQLWEEKTGAQVTVCTRSAMLTKALSSFRVSVEELRGLLIAVKKAGKACSSAEALAAAARLPLPAALSGLYILRDMKLCAFELAPFLVCLVKADPHRDNDPRHDPLYDLLNCSGNTDQMR